MVDSQNPIVMDTMKTNASFGLPICLICLSLKERPYLIRGLNRTQTQTQTHTHIHTDTNTHRYTHTHAKNITFTAYAGGNDTVVVSLAFTEAEMYH